MKTLNVREADRVRIVELDRPEALNAFSNQLMDELTDVFLDTAVDDAVSVLVLTGAGRAFSAGADLAEMGEPLAPPRHGFDGLLEAIITFPKPFLLAVNGVGAGIGATIAGLADLTFMARNARLRCPFSALGVSAEAGSTLLFPRLMGHQRAFWFLTSSEWWSAEQCVSAGLAMEVCDDDQLLPRTLEHATTLARLPIDSLTTIKRLMTEPDRNRLRAVFAAENRELARLVGGPANREAVAAFREKRDPDFGSLPTA